MKREEARHQEQVRVAVQIESLNHQVSVLTTDNDVGRSRIEELKTENSLM